MLSARKCLRYSACFRGPPSLARVFEVTVLLSPVPFPTDRVSGLALSQAARKEVLIYPFGQETASYIEHEQSTLGPDLSSHT